MGWPATRTVCLAVFLALTAVRGELRAQGLATSAVSGVVTGADGRAVESGEVVVTNGSTGFTTRGPLRGGRFLVRGLEVGGPYAVMVRAVGFRPQVQDSLFLALGQNLQVEFRLPPMSVELPAIPVAVERAPDFSRARTGMNSVVSDSTLRRLPTANRDLYDFVRLSPHVSTQHGLSGGGANFRFNNFLIDGASAQAPFGRLPAGTTAGGKLIPLEAVKEYQVVLASHDVWQGDFSGVSVNAVTRGGTNELHGSAYSYFRNDQLARNTTLLRASPYQRLQYGLSVGGPIIRDRALFFIATEFQRLNAPASGPFAGQDPSAGTVPVDTLDINRFATILHTYGLEGGSGGAITNGNPLVNLFARLDVMLPGRIGRLVLEHNYAGTHRDLFDRTSSPAVFPLSSYAYRQSSQAHVTVAQLYSSLPNGAANELIASHYVGPIRMEPGAPQPLVFVTVPRVGGGTSLLEAGTNQMGQHNLISQHSLEFRDDLTLQVGRSHRFTVGAKAAFFGVGVQAVISNTTGVFGRWEFSSLDSLASGVASAYSVAKDFGGGDALFSGAVFSAHVTDQWERGHRVSRTRGVRADLPVTHGTPPYAAVVDSLFQRRTDVLPASAALWSPRIGLNWDITGDGRNQVRIGGGLFVGQPPWNWWTNALKNYGLGIRTLSCGTKPTDAGLPPPFAPDSRNPPQACANGGTFSTTGGGSVSLLDRHLTFPRALRVSLAYDHRLPWGIVVTAEAVYTRMLGDLIFVNRALSGPVGSDPHGRILYGTINAAGLATPGLVDVRFPDVIDLASQSRDYSYDVVLQLERRFSHRMQGSIAYAYSRARDLQTPLFPLAIDNWRNGRALSSRHDMPQLGISDFDQPQRIIIAASYTMPWRRWQTDVSFYYVGGSGAPFTFTAAGALGKGDLNADGTNLNDPIYVPRSAADTMEVRFSGNAAQVASQQAAFDALIDQTPCLRRQRGRIEERNSCRAPWVHTMNLALRQSLPGPHRHTLSLELQVFNVLNLLSGSWGLVSVPQTKLLSQVGQTAGPAATAQPVFQFDPAFKPYSTDNVDSYYQVQLAVRYAF